MSFMIGPSPIRRTPAYLNLGKIIFRETVKIFSINYNAKDKHHEGAREFIFWKLGQIQYKNPYVQCVTFMNITPSPFIRIFFENGKSVLIDIDSRDKDEIEDHLANFTAVCKSEKEKTALDTLEIIKKNPSYFGFFCKRQCMCEVLGQVPCPCVVKLPNIWRGHKKPRQFRIPPSLMEPGLEEEEKEED